MSRTANAQQHRQAPAQNAITRGPPTSTEPHEPGGQNLYRLRSNKRRHKASAPRQRVRRTKGTSHRRKDAFTRGHQKGISRGSESEAGFHGEQKPFLSAYFFLISCNRGTRGVQTSKGGHSFVKGCVGNTFHAQPKAAESTNQWHNRQAGADKRTSRTAKRSTDHDQERQQQHHLDYGSTITCSHKIIST